MEINTEDQKQEFLNICRDAIHRDGIEDLQKSDFFTAPAGTHYGTAETA